VAKAAAIHLTRSAAVELGEKGIRINTIFARTDRHWHFWQGRRPRRR
jgi:NAD(P)-dependent dehydrogenase (short-subunit alcohol dehydrogenase family)